MNPGDLERAKVRSLHITEWEFINTSGISQIREADACLLLANKYCQDPDAEDAGEK